MHRPDREAVRTVGEGLVVRDRLKAGRWCQLLWTAVR
ncbi:MAG: hypothetical protein QOI76_3093 [Frankiales bacterium]|jgi:hypothetical protein|nr:hypothetical protein [Frankiales bacterium]